MNIFLNAKQYKCDALHRKNLYVRKCNVEQERRNRVKERETINQTAFQKSMSSSEQANRRMSDRFHFLSPDFSIIAELMD